MKTVVIVTRHPDYSNEFEVIEGDEPGVKTFDVDLGRSDLGDKDELAEWLDNHEVDVAELRAEGYDAAADAYQSILDFQKQVNS